MAFVERLKLIGTELRVHAPFTILGALSGIVFMLAFRNADQSVSQGLFSVFHPAHVLLSAMVTASLFQLHRGARHFVKILLVGYIGAIGVATLSDSVLPYFGEELLGVAIPTHAATHDHGAHEQDTAIDEHAGHDHGEHAATVDEHAIDEHGHETTAAEEVHDHDGGAAAGDEHGHDEHAAEDDEGHLHVRPELHLGFIEEWYLVNPAALLGILIAYFRPTTKFPHAMHVLLSTWASSAHVLMNTHADWTVQIFVGAFVVLFIAVWLPCCVSDIIFPLLFVDASPEHTKCWLCSHGHSATPEVQHEH